MYKKMLVPLDGSQLAEVVLPYATELVARLDLEATLLHVNTPEERGLAPTYRAYIERMAEVLRRQSEVALQKLGTSPVRTKVNVRVAFAEGHAAEEILRYADDNNVDLLLIATHGRSGIRGWALGGVADKVLRGSRAPVWLVPAGMPQEPPYDKWPRRTLLVPLDGSQIAESVLPHVEALAKQRGPEPSEVLLLSVCEPPVVPADFPPVHRASWEEEVKDEMEKGKLACERYVEEVEKRLTGAGLAVRAEAAAGDAAEQIVEYAGKDPYSIIVLATHGRSGLTRWAYGSVTAKVLQGTANPVFLVRAQASNKRMMSDE
ncbi:MAG: universal stress protein [Chloroflexi bacterium]|nr:universal stress protein [Chloroflexota bacterium]